MRVTSEKPGVVRRDYGGPMMSAVPSPNTPTVPASYDPAGILTLPDLVAALNLLRAGRSYDGLNRALAHQRTARRLSRSTVSDLLNGKSTPTKDTLVNYLTACGLPESQRLPWLAAWERVKTSHLRQPEGAVQVRNADPRRHGVHDCIHEGGGTDLPVYVMRDRDADLRTRVKAAGRRGGFVLLTGRSSVGKTRMLFEAVRAELPDWWLLHPDNAAAVREFADNPVPRTVVWLDELQNYLQRPASLTTGTVRGLLAAGLVVVATLWPEEYVARAAVHSPGQDDRYGGDRKLLGLATVIDVASFSPAERRRAEHHAYDPRIRIALHTSTPEVGVTEVLAAGPELVRRWENSPDNACYGKAVITAALDARRVGAHAPLTREFLAAAVPAYLSETQKATAPPDWWKEAIEYATKPVHGAAACLSPVSAGMGVVAGYVTADYLHQSARRERRAVPLAPIVWQTLAELVSLDDADQVAWSARRRLQHRYADILERRCAQAGDSYAARRLAARLAADGRSDEAIASLQQHLDSSVTDLATLLRAAGRPDDAIAVLRTGLNAGNAELAFPLAELLAGRDRAAEAISVLRRHPELSTGLGGGRAGLHLAELLAQQGLVAQLQERVDQGDTYYAHPQLAKLLAAQEDTEALRARAEHGDSLCARTLATLLSRRGDIAEAARVLQLCADGYSARSVARDLAQDGHAGAAISLLRLLVADHDEHAVTDLAELLARSGTVDDAIALLNAHVGCGGQIGSACQKLAGYLADRGHVDEAAAVLAEHGDLADYSIRSDYITLLERQGRIDEAAAVLRTHADLYRLGGLLVQHDRLEEAIEVARQLVAVGDCDGPRRLAELLAATGDEAELRSLAAGGDVHAARHLADTLKNTGRLDELEQRADKGDRYAQYTLIDALVAADRHDEAMKNLRAQADGGDVWAAVRMAEMLVDRQRIEDAVEVARSYLDVHDAASTARFAKAIARHGGFGDAVAMMNRCTGRAASEAALRLCEIIYLAGPADLEELRTLADSGQQEAAGRLVELLADSGDVKALYDEVHAGTHGAADRLSAVGTTVRR